MRLKTRDRVDEPGRPADSDCLDPGFARDVESWCRLTGNTLLAVNQEGGRISAEIEKGKPQTDLPQRAGTGTTLVVFSDDLDRALASFVIANGAAASGREVTLFFTFWGLNVLKNPHAGRVQSAKKDLWADSSA